MIFIDIGLAVLLTATIAYSLRLNRNLKQLRSGREEALHFMEEFSRSINKAERTVSELKQLNLEVTEEIKHKIDEARFLCNDLAFLVQKGVETSDELYNKRNSKRDNKELLLANETKGRVYVSTPDKKPALKKEFMKRAGNISSGKINNAFNKVNGRSGAEKTALSKRQAIEEAVAKISKRKLVISADEIDFSTHERHANNNAADKKVINAARAKNKRSTKPRRLFDVLPFTEIARQLRS